MRERDGGADGSALRSRPRRERHARRKVTRAASAAAREETRAS